MANVEIGEITVKMTYTEFTYMVLNYLGDQGDVAIHNDMNLASLEKDHTVGEDGQITIMLTQ